MWWCGFKFSRLSLSNCQTNRKTSGIFCSYSDGKCQDHNTNTRFSGCIHCFCLNGTEPVGKQQQPLTSTRFDIRLPLIFVSPTQHALSLQMMLASSCIHLGGIRKRLFFYKSHPRFFDSKNLSRLSVEYLGFWCLHEATSFCLVTECNSRLNSILPKISI